MAPEPVEVNKLVRCPISDIAVEKTDKYGKNIIFVKLPPQIKTTIAGRTEWELVAFSEDNCPTEVTDVLGRVVTPVPISVSHILSSMASKNRNENENDNITSEEFLASAEKLKEGPHDCYMCNTINATEEEGSMQYRLTITKTCNDEDETPLKDPRSEKTELFFPSNIDYAAVRESLESQIDTWVDKGEIESQFLSGKDYTRNEICITMLCRDIFTEEYNFQKEKADGNKVTKLSLKSIENFLKQDDIYRDDIEIKRENNFLIPLTEEQLNIFMADMERIMKMLMEKEKSNLYGILPVGPEKHDLYVYLEKQPQNKRRKMMSG